MELAHRVDEALGFMEAAGLTLDHPIMTQTEFWTSDEGVLARTPPLASFMTALLTSYGLESVLASLMVPMRSSSEASKPSWYQGNLILGDLSTHVIPSLNSAFEKHKCTQSLKKN